MRTTNRFWPRSFLIPVMALSLGACGDDDGNGPDPTASIQDLAEALAQAVGAQAPAADAEKNIRNVAGATCKVMAQNGGCASAGVGPAEGLVTPLQGILAVLPERAEGDRWGGALSSGAPALQILPAPPLGATCVWSVENSSWAGGDDIFGAVPGDRTRFEAYETDDSDPGTPVLPLDPTGLFFDVAPIVQNTPETPTGQVNVEITSDESGGGSVLDLLLAGTVDPADGEVIDLLMSGRSGSGTTTALDYLFSIDRDNVTNTMQIGELLVVSTLDSSGDVSIFIQKRNSPRQAVEYRFRLSANNLISSGDVYVGNDRVAGMSGDRGAPLFDLTADFEELANLEFVYDELLGLDTRVIDLFFVGYCVGANTPEACGSMLNRFF
ncbi:MAG TPA: hypothetical protein VK858_15915 [Longimicrobiales bacterium]|nr:hypothetical protein [Longimicrobiales bacterium]